MEDCTFVLTTEAARILQRSADTVRRYERTGLLKATRTRSGVRLFDRRDVEQLAQQQQSDGGRDAG